MHIKLPEINRLFIFLTVTINFQLLCAGVFGSDVRSGVDSDDALRVAINCVQASSGVEAYQEIFDGKQPVFLSSRINPEDNLKAAGVTDDYRLNVLRNYIVRNREIGVPSLWGRSGDDFPYQIQSYMIPFAALKKVNSETTVAELAAIIKANAGLPYLPKSRAASIVSCCRCRTDACRNAERCTKIDPPVSSSKKIADDAEVRVDLLIACIDKNPQIGLESAFIEDPTGETYRYKIGDETFADYKRKITAGWTYRDLIENLARDAYVPATSEFVSTRMVVDAVTELTGADPPRKSSFELYELFSPVFANKSSSIRSGGMIFNQDDSLQSLSIGAGQMRRALVDVSGRADRYTYVYRIKKKNYRVRQFSEAELQQIKPQTTIKQLIGMIGKLLNETSNKSNTEAVK